jgi:hypothetical protein
MLVSEEVAVLMMKDGDLEKAAIKGDVAEYLEDLPPATLIRLYEEPSTALAVYRYVGTEVGCRRTLEGLTGPLACCRN